MGFEPRCKVTSKNSVDKLILCAVYEMQPAVYKINFSTERGNTYRQTIKLKFSGTFSTGLPKMNLSPLAVLPKP